MINTTTIIGWIILIVSFLTLGSCKKYDKEIHKLDVKKESWGRTEEGREIYLYTLSNIHGMQIKIINYGAIVQSLFVPDKSGKFEDVVLGYDRLDDYLKDSPYFGAIVGRYGNRIARGRFTLDGVQYQLATNNGPNHLHGGIKGFDKVVWNAEPIHEKDKVRLKLTYLSPDGEEGYPGNLKVAVIYSLTNHNELEIEYFAQTDKATPVNLTHHGYFNLTGHCKRDILEHQLWINADYFTPVDSTLIPTGELRPVEGTPFDFRQPTAIGARINDPDEQLKYGRGYDHNWVLNQADGNLKLQASLYDPQSGRYMQIYTDQPGLQFYSGNFLDGSIVGKGGVVYKHRYGLCLETQHFPDSPNHPEFPSTILRPGEQYHTKTIYKFSIK